MPAVYPLMDIGANLTHESFADDMQTVLEDAQAAGVAHLSVTGASTQGSIEALALAQQYPKLLIATAGIHPHHAEEACATNMATLAQLLTAPLVKAVGETGLDYFRNLAPEQAQIKAFEAHIELAISTGLPMFLHEREASKAFLEVLTPYRDQLSELVVHCFTGERDALFRYLDLDCHIGITGWICDERRGHHLLELVGNIPLSRLMIETDAPYLLPRSLRPKPRGRRNEPRWLPHIAQTVANASGHSYQALAEATTKTALAFFRLAP